MLLVSKVKFSAIVALYYFTPGMKLTIVFYDLVYCRNSRHLAWIDKIIGEFHNPELTIIIGYFFNCQNRFLAHFRRLQEDHQRFSSIHFCNFFSKTFILKIDDQKRTFDSIKLHKIPVCLKRLYCRFCLLFFQKLLLFFYVTLFLTCIFFRFQGNVPFCTISFSFWEIKFNYFD